MKCCVPFCKNTTKSSAKSLGITFHKYPSEHFLRAAWLEALGQQESHIINSDVVCSQHFLSDDIYEASSGLRLIGAVPAAVQVCTICLDTDSKLISMSKYKLEQAYENLTGLSASDEGSLRPALCVECAQRLGNFSRFRDKSLRAAVLMMDLVEKHEMITLQHIKPMDRIENQLKSNMVETVFEPNHFDLYIEYPDDNNDTELVGHSPDDTKPTIENGNNPVEGIVVKNEKDCEPMLVDEDLGEAKIEITDENENNSDIDNDDVYSDDNISDERITLDTKLLNDTLCRVVSMKIPILEELMARGYKDIQNDSTFRKLLSQEFSDRVTKGDTHLKRGRSPGVERPRSGLPPAPEQRPAVHKPSDGSFADYPQSAGATWSVVKLTQNKEKLNPTAEGHTNEALDGPLVTTDGDIRSESSIENNDIRDRGSIQTKSKHCMRFDKAALNRDPLLTATEKNNWSCREFKQNEHLFRHSSIKPTSQTFSKSDKPQQSQIILLNNDIENSPQNISLIENLEERFTCDICKIMFKRKDMLLEHILSTHNVNKLFYCKYCPYKFKYNSFLKRHIATHTGEKPFACELCGRKFIRKCDVSRHLTTHTGEKPFTCDSCGRKFLRKHNLVRHRGIHTAKS